VGTTANFQVCRSGAKVRIDTTFHPIHFRAVQKNEFFRQCVEANVPAGTIPWHMDCDPSTKPSKCEVGSECVHRAGSSFCEPTPQMVLIMPSAKCSRSHRSTGATVGIIFLVFGLFGVLCIAGFGAHFPWMWM
jgi:hypothetical protein